jgi:hypothetical protein
MKKAPSTNSQAPMKSQNPIADFLVIKSLVPLWSLELEVWRFQL